MRAKALHLFQAVQIGFVRVHGFLGGSDAGLGFGDLRFGHGEVGFFLIGFLAGHHAALCQPPPAFDGKPRQVQIGFGKVQVGLHLVQRWIAIGIA